MSKGREAGYTASPPFEIIRPCWLIAVGDSSRVEVIRSVQLREDDESIDPIREFVSEHGLVLAAQRTFDDIDGFIRRKVVMSVYVTPAVRNGVLAGTELSVPWLGAGLAAAE